MVIQCAEIPLLHSAKQTLKKLRVSMDIPSHSSDKLLFKNNVTIIYINKYDTYMKMKVIYHFNAECN